MEFEINLEHHNNYANIKQKCKTKFDEWYNSFDYHHFSDVIKQIKIIANEVATLVFNDIYAIKILEEALHEYLHNYLHAEYLK